MATITTSTSAAATQVASQRKLDRCQDGTLLAIFNDGTPNGVLRYSKDKGTTWASAATDIAGLSNASIFVDLDDYIHVVWKQSGTGGSRSDGFCYYMRGTPNAGRTAWTWSTAQDLTGNLSPGDVNNPFFDHPDLIVHREGTGWMVHIVLAYFRAATGHNYVCYFRAGWSSGGVFTRYPDEPINFSGANDLGYIGGTYNIAVSSYPSIDFNHAGDGKSVAGATPHLYVAWSAGGTGAGKGVRFRKSTYSGGTWTWGTEREISSGHYDDSNTLTTLFDGTAVVIVGSSLNTGAQRDLRIWERDAADSTTTTLASESALSNANKCISASSSYDMDRNVHVLGRNTEGTRQQVALKYTRATGTLTRTITSIVTEHYSLKRSSTGGAIEYVYTAGSGSPYTVTYDSIATPVPVMPYGAAYGSRTYGGGASVATTVTATSIDSGSIVLDGTGSFTIDGVVTATVDSGSIAFAGTGTWALGTITLLKMGAATFDGTGTFVAAGAPVAYQEVVLSGFEFHLSAFLSLDTSTALTSVEVRDLLRVSPTMRTPVIISGRPIHPDVIMTGTAAVTVNGTVTNPDPPATSGATPPTGGAPSPTYKWLASSLGAVGTEVSTWAATGGGPSWSSGAPFRPTVSSIVVNSELTYSKALVFWNDFVEHMWLNLGGSIAQPYTWQITAILNGTSDTLPQNMLDSGGPTVTAGYTAGQRVRNVNTSVADGSNTHLMKVKPTQAELWAGNNFFVSAPATRRACVYTACFNGVDSFFRIRGKNYRYSGRGHPGSNPTEKVLLGRRTGILDDNYASHMAVLEVRFYNQALTENQLEYNIEPGLFATYNFAKW